MKKYIFCFLVNLLFFTVSYGQPEAEMFAQKKLPSFIPASPNASSIARLADINTNNYTGLVNISIPIYDISLRQLKVPVNFSYNSSGVKVEEYSSSYGMSWSLTAGGVITRTVKGMQDDAPGGYIAAEVGKSVDLYVRDMMNAQDKANFEKQAAEGSIDTEPDVYTYSFPGQSGKFCMAPTGRILTIPHEPLKIVKDGGGFIITDTHGNKYEFKQQEYTFSYLKIYNGETNVSSTPPLDETLNNTWYLTKITTVFNEEITFSYSASTIKPTYNGNNAGYFLAEPVFPKSCLQDGGGSSPHPLQYYVKTTSVQEIKQQKVRTIKFPNGEIEFNYLQERTDLPGDSALTNIKIKNANNLIKEYNLNYNYFASRLFLSKVQESGLNNTISPYTIEYYNPLDLPDRSSFSQDYWGYYNGAANGSLIPKTYNTYPGYFALFPISFGDANREPQADKMKYGMISKITYPTGGYSLFDFEPNSYFKNGSKEISDTTFIEKDNFINLVAPPSGNVSYSNTFNIEFPQNVIVDYNVYGGETYVKLLKIVDGVENLIFSKYGNFNNPDVGAKFIDLLPGTYKFEGFNYEEEFKAIIFLTYKSKQNYTVAHEKIGGGIRIKKITDFDNIAAKANTREFIYKADLQDDHSSGVLLNFPIYNYFQRFVRMDKCPGDPPSSLESVANYYVVLSSPVIALSTTAGSYVGYKGAIVRTNSQQEQGYTKTTYRAPDDFPDYNFPGFPHTPAISKDYNRGQPIKERVYNNANSNIVEDTLEYIDGTYAVVHNNDWLAAGANIGFFEKHITWPDQDIINSQKYFLYAGYNKLKHTTKVIKDGANSSLISDNKFYYDNVSHLFPTRQESINSKGEKATTYNIYPTDYAAGNGFINEMVNKNIITKPIESITTSEINGVTSIKEGIINEYKQSFPAVLDKTYALEPASTLTLTNFKFSNESNNGVLPFLDLVKIAFQKDSKYKEQMNIIQVDTKGNVLTHLKTNDILSSYVWDYKTTLPVAECTNANNTDIAATSFEADGKGNFSFAGLPVTDVTSPTGKKAYSLGSGSISKTGLNAAKTYIISYWSKNGAQTVNVANAKIVSTKNGWTCYSHEVVNPAGGIITISGAGTIDELRLYPKEAQMTTYAYEPLIGITTQCDANNNILYYEYDSLNRLKLIRDDKKNVVKTFNYNYQQPNN